MSLNKVMLIGRVGHDPEVRTIDGDRKVAGFSLATSKRYTDRSGERKEQTEWHRVSVFGKSADFVDKYVKKGDQLYVEGELRTRSFTDKSGQEKQVTEVVADQVQRLASQGDENSERRGQQSSGVPENFGSAPKQDDGEYNTDDLPF